MIRRQLRRTTATWVGLFASLALACGGAEEPPVDAGTDAFAPRLPDAGPGDGGPPPTGCGATLVIAADAGVPSGPDGGVLDPAGFAPALGPGAPARTFAEAELFAHCGYLDHGPTDEQHHNTGFMLDGYLVRTWAHERGRGGVAVFDMSDPCAPVTVANVLDEQIRETHATGYSTINGRWIAVASLTGIEFWDVSDIRAPVMVNDFVLPGVRYPDSYMRVVLSVFWQAPYVYVGGADNGVFIVDATNPRAPLLVGQYTPLPRFRVGNVHAVGNLLVVMGTEGSRIAMVDISEPAAPRAIPGGSFLISNGVEDRFGRPIPTTAYFGMVSGGLSYHARNGLGGGLAIYDIHDPRTPTFLGNVDSGRADGGYVYLFEGIAFVGLSDYGLAYDVSDPSAPTEIGRFDLAGDLDTVTPIANVALVSVDDDAVDGHATAIVPWRTTPDTRGPRVSWVLPDDGATERAITTRVGLTFDEFVAMESVWQGSVLLRQVRSGELLPGFLSGQEGVVNFWPVQPLAPSTEYEIIVPAGGVTDLSGNPIEETFRASFTTVACED